MGNHGYDYSHSFPHHNKYIMPLFNNVYIYISACVAQQAKVSDA